MMYMVTLSLDLLPPYESFTSDSFDDRYLYSPDGDLAACDNAQYETHFPKHIPAKSHYMLL